MRKRGCLLFALLLPLVLFCSCAFLLPKEDCTQGHDLAVLEVIQKPSCGVAGVQKMYCKRCSYAEQQEIAPTGQHRLQGWQTTVSPTLDSEGERVQVCERCGLTAEREVLIPIGEVVDVQTTGERIAVSLADYTLLHDGAVNGFYKGAVEELCEALRAVSGEDMIAKTDSAVPDRGGAEILVGQTNRALSESAKSLIKGNGFAVVMEGERIAIVGSDEMQTIQAIQYFIRTYLTDTTATALYARAVASNVSVQTLATDKGCDYDVVFDHKLHNDKKHQHVASSTSDSRDFPCVVAEQLSIALADLTEAKGALPVVRSDDKFGTLEVLLGTMERPDAQYCLSLLEGDEYGILVKDSKVILAARNDQALDACVEEFLFLLGSCVSDTGEGGYAYCLPEGFYATGRVTGHGWILDFPKPQGEGIALENTQYVNDNSLQFLYTGSGVCAESYLAYCDMLVSEGYTVLTENGMEGSLFKTFVHTSKAVTLYVAYNDFKHEADYAVEDKYSVDYERCIRIISAPTSKVSLPDAGLLSEDPAYVKKTESSITALPYHGKAVGMGYVILLEDGRLVVIDGGGVNEGGSEDMMLWQTICAIHERASGAVTGSGNPVHIAAWINTHSHWDHYNAFTRMLEKYGRTGLLRMDYLLGNFPDESVIYAVKGETLLMGKSETISKLQSRVEGGFTYVKVHTGQRFYLANLTLEILMTFEDHFPRRICNSNDTCTIVRYTFKGDEAAAGTPTTAIFLADAFRYQSRFLCAMYGSYLQSDIVQLAHHGNIGCEKAVYAAIAPTTVFFPNAYDKFVNYAQDGHQSLGWHYAVDHFVAYELESVKYIFIADNCCVTLPFVAGRPDHDGIHNAQTGEGLAYNGSFLQKK